MNAALRLDSLSVAYGAAPPVLHDISLSVAPGEAYGLVGESGCGKTTAAFAALRALPAGARVAGGISVDGQDVTALAPRALRHWRARRVSIVYQDPGRALNPTLTIGTQLRETLALLGITGVAARARAAAMLARLHLADPARVLAAYPHELSGGMQQRVCIAMALFKDPALLILDEPTTALDAAAEQAVISLLAGLRQHSRAALLFISHNLALVARLCDRAGVLYAGRLVEEGRAGRVLRAPLHPYTAGLLRSVPRGVARRDGRLPVIAGALPAPGETLPGCAYAPRCALVLPACTAQTPPPRGAAGHQARCLRAGETPHPEAPAAQVPAAQDQAAAEAPWEADFAAAPPVLELRGLNKTYGRGGRIVADIALTLRAGETLGLVGESGSGKTTLARMIMGLTPPDAGGRILLLGHPAAPRARLRPGADLRALQLVFQNPDAALNRAHTVRRLLLRPLRLLGGVAGAAARDALHALLQAICLPEAALGLRPAELSGGMKQRLAIGRAFAGQPRIVVCDEPSSALDVSVQAAILNLLADLRARDGVAYVLISHDLAVIRYLADRVAVMYRGRIVEIGAAERIFAGPRHPYTDTLIAAAGLAPPVPQLDARPAPAEACAFAPLCPKRIGACDLRPALTGSDAHRMACHVEGKRDDLF